MSLKNILSINFIPSRVFPVLIAPHYILRLCFFYVDNISKNLSHFASVWICIYLIPLMTPPFIDLIYDLSTKWEAFIKSTYK